MNDLLLLLSYGGLCGIVGLPFSRILVRILKLLLIVGLLDRCSRHDAGGRLLVDDPFNEGLNLITTLLRSNHCSNPMGLSRGGL